MARVKKTLAQQIAELDEPVANDYDPEEDVKDVESEEGSAHEDEEDEDAGTEHYVAVGKSKLRKKEDVALGPHYAGARISREALEDDDSESDYEDAEENLAGVAFADPENVDLENDEEDGDINSDEALGESDEEKFKDFTFRGSGKPREKTSKKYPRKTAADFMSASEDEDSGGEGDAEEIGAMEDLEVVSEDADDLDEDEDMEDSESGSDMDGNFDEDEDDEDDEDESEEESSTKVKKSSKSALRKMMQMDADEDEDSEDSEDEIKDDTKSALLKLMKAGERSVVATISQDAKSEAAKGNAVKKQRKTFDSFLNIRIRLQKALVATNSLAPLDSKVKSDAAASEPYLAAEEAALTLLNTLSTMQSSLTAASTGSKKRKRTTFTSSTPSSAIAASLQEASTQALPARNSLLEKWYSRTRDSGSSAVHQQKRQVGPSASTASTSVVSFIQDQLSQPERLIARTRVPRSCAPIQASSKTASADDIYDDADFYQLLLKELIDQRMVDSSSAAAGTTATFGLKQWTAVKEAKTRKQVDTKASKGRKMRFTVHEKLQNFMAPEDRGSWEEEAVGRFFNGLFGRVGGLDEDDVEMEDDDNENENAEEEALMLFRS